MKKFFQDLFMGIGNSNWELARIAGTWSILTYSFAFVYSLVVNHVELDFSALGVGFAALLAGVAALIYTKDKAKTDAIVQGAAPNANT